MMAQMVVDCRFQWFGLQKKLTESLALFEFSSYWGWGGAWMNGGHVDLECRMLICSNSIE